MLRKSIYIGFGFFRYVIFGSFQYFQDLLNVHLIKCMRAVKNPHFQFLHTHADFVCLQTIRTDFCTCTFASVSIVNLHLSAALEETFAYVKYGKSHDM